MLPLCINANFVLFLDHKLASYFVETHICQLTTLYETHIIFKQK